MLNRLTFIVSLIIFAWIDLGYSQNILRLAIPDFPPYTFKKDGKTQGSGVEKVDKIMKEAGIQYTVEYRENYARVFEETKSGLADGFFLASQNAERDKIAVFSNPVFINRWCWFYPIDSTLINPKEVNFKNKAKVGTYLNSNTHQWLIKNGYKVTGSPSNIESLIKMLKADRINVVFLAESVFLDAISKIGEKPERYKKIIQDEKPFGIYISKEYLKKNPDVMNKVNIAINKVAALK